MQINQIANAEKETMAAFADRVIDHTREGDHHAMVLDLRHNNGGNGYLNPAILRAVIHFQTTRRGRPVFVLQGPATFSAAQNLLTELERLTDVITVGERSGSRPNFVGEDTNVVLPWSGLQGSIASRWFQHSRWTDARPWIAPDIPVPLTAADYFANRDQALKVVAALVTAAP